MRKSLLALFTLAVAASIAACGGGGGGGGGGDVNSIAATSAPAPSITLQPVDQSVLTDGTASFTVSATGTAMTYQWLKDGVVIPGATTVSYTTLPANYASNGAKYSVAISSPTGNLDSAPAFLTLKLSDNQKSFENLVLAPSAGSYEIDWNLNLLGPQTSGTNYIRSASGQLMASPLTTGTQTSTLTPAANMANTLALPTSNAATRVLKNGAVLVVSNNFSAAAVPAKYVYTGSDVLVNTLAADGVTVAFSQVRSNYLFTTLTGLVSSSPKAMTESFQALFANTANLYTTATYTAGAGYLTYTATNKGDVHTAFDCNATTTDANISPCSTNTTLNAALTAGIPSASDGVTYTLANGVISAVGGVPVWVANTARPTDGTRTVTQQYRIYFQLGTSVYTGALTKDGTVLGGNWFVASPLGVTPIIYGKAASQIRLNKATIDSIKAALKI